MLSKSKTCITQIPTSKTRAEEPFLYRYHSENMCRRPKSYRFHPESIMKSVKDGKNQAYICPDIS